MQLLLLHLFQYSLTKKKKKKPYSIDKIFIVIQKKKIVQPYSFNSLGWG